MGTSGWGFLNAVFRLSFNKLREDASNLVIIALVVVVVVFVFVSIECFTWAGIAQSV
jgi:hypothetical protein